MLPSRLLYAVNDGSIIPSGGGVSSRKGKFPNSRKKLCYGFPSLGFQRGKLVFIVAVSPCQARMWNEIIAISGKFGIFLFRTGLLQEVADCSAYCQCPIQTVFQRDSPGCVPIFPAVSAAQHCTVSSYLLSCVQVEPALRQVRAPIQSQWQRNFSANKESNVGFLLRADCPFR